MLTLPPKGTDDGNSPAGKPTGELALYRSMIRKLALCRQIVAPEEAVVDA
jgi:hypothetical protein